MDIKKLDITLADFCYKMTETRDPSHGYNHMRRVAVRARQIADDEKMNEADIKCVLICAWMHDIADHKYDKTGALRQALLAFLAANFPSDCVLLSNIIDRVSFSRESKHGQKDWLEVLGPRGIAIRNVVSDADKLEALGAIGFQRTIDFNRHKWAEDHTGEMPTELLKGNIVAHCHEKLFTLVDYLYTAEGKRQGVAEQKIFNDMIATL